jgi:hypothetical protein
MAESAVEFDGIFRLPDGNDCKRPLAGRIDEPCGTGILGRGDRLEITN